MAVGSLRGGTFDILPDGVAKDAGHRPSASLGEDLATLYKKRLLSKVRASQHTLRAAQLRKLILLGLDTHPCDQILLMQLAFLHEFDPMHREILARYTRACDEEADSKNFSLLAQGFDEAADPFDYGA